WPSLVTSIRVTDACVAVATLSVATKASRDLMGTVLLFAFLFPSYRRRAREKSLLGSRIQRDLETAVRPARQSTTRSTTPQLGSHRLPWLRTTSSRSAAQTLR